MSSSSDPPRNPPASVGGDSFNFKGKNVRNVAQGRGSRAGNTSAAPSHEKEEEEEGVVQRGVFVFTARELERRAASSVFASSLGEVCVAVCSHHTACSCFTSLYLVVVLVLA